MNIVAFLMFLIRICSIASRMAIASAEKMEEKGEILYRKFRCREGQ